MPFEPGQRVVAAVEALGPLTGTILREASDPDGVPTGSVPEGAPRIYVVQWTLDGGDVVTNTAAETALRAAD